MQPAGLPSRSAVRERPPGLQGLSASSLEPGFPGTRKSVSGKQPRILQESHRSQLGEGLPGPDGQRPRAGTLFSEMDTHTSPVLSSY